MNPALDVRNLRVHFLLDEGTVRAVDGVSFSVEPGKTLGIVGESGSGKSVIGQSILRIVPYPGKIVEGEIILQIPNGQDIPTRVNMVELDPHGRQARSIRGKEVGMIFQEPMNSFSPVHTIGSQITEALSIHADVSAQEARNRAIEMLRKVGIPQPEHRIDSYPHQLSGGMRQRAMIAMALVCNPRILIADEPTTALDVTIQAQILDLLKQLQEEFGMAILFISHNLGVISEISHDVLVIYFGRVMERAPVDVLFRDPLHPYTKALLKSVPGIDTPVRTFLSTIEGTLPDPYISIPGCPFFGRCMECGGSTVCRDSPYELTKVDDRHFVACPQMCIPNPI
ncbi:ABC transporter ATP-binding protein [Desulfomonile tiedjei]|uniref:Oligopeptide/dipeptide ABC transporter, ATP-binding protein n=1 Tax=Desulfomonile tiedjei (strain ATCC 49306 / DSM 6799 / DCB-1) TaxID=706587 RepID=I4CF69_DESTA|nr:ABC transporter ATP-binding protein [Desulfomonile tiedjei]AFM28210.1 oligopeptide/dipeptide ABC transporter, ATP-binding protein [Desulfomonile tiedjei DSM 6799]